MGASFDEMSRDEVRQMNLPPSFNDPLWSKQWNLYNKDAPGHDINVLPVWQSGFTGKGVKIAMLDDGVWHEHADLFHAIDARLAWDIHADRASAIPMNLEKEKHGTRCAGQIVSKPDNGVCGVGVAWDARIVPLRMLPQQD